MGKFKRAIIGTIITVTVLGVALGATISYVNNYGTDYENKIPTRQDVTHHEMETIKAIGRGLYDKDGARYEIKGVNFGNWLIQESWMSVNSLGPVLNDDGSYASINYEGTVEEYVKVYQEELEQALINNPNLTEEQVKTLWDVYYKSYCKEEDFQNIKNIGLNTIRLPMYYRTFMEGPDDNLVMKENAFELVDWFLEMAKKYDLKVILDMHGVVGGQSGHEHSGTRKKEFWTNPNYIAKMCELWGNIAYHYKEVRPDLAYTILAYDLVNEPAYQGYSTTILQWEVMNLLYKAIRAIDKDHVISIEGCWHFNNLPDPKKYGWENVLYQYHIYNWDYQKIKNDIFYTYHWLTFAFNDYEVPKFIGEFTFFDQKDEWVKYLNKYDERGLGWTLWTYKTISVGWWDSSWGIYVNRLNLKNEQLKLDVRSATYDEIYDVWSKQGTNESYQTGLLKEALNEYFIAD